MNTTDSWPPLQYESWKDTLDSLHMKMQIIGKVKLALNPFLMLTGISARIHLRAVRNA